MSSKNKSLSLFFIFFAQNRFCNIKTTHKLILQYSKSLKESTGYNNVPKTAFAGLLLVPKRDILSPQSGVKEKKDLFMAVPIVSDPSVGAGGTLVSKAGHGKKNWQGARQQWNDGRLGLKC